MKHPTVPLVRHRIGLITAWQPAKGNIMGFTFNKALGGGVAAALLSLLGLLQPFAEHVPLLGAVIGVGTFILTWFTPKNADPKPSTPPSP